MIRTLLFIICLSLLELGAAGQPRGEIRIMSYNTENLFDTFDDPLTSDEDFTPTGRMHWTNEKYHHKLLNIYKVIAGVGGWQPPEIIGLVEIENRKVLNDLLTTTPLSKYKYGIVHYESPDPRGIDVGLLYRSDKFKVIHEEPIYINFMDNPERKTRNILFVKLLYNTSDTLCIFVNHWPSRRGGELVTEELRSEVATVLRDKLNAVFRTNPSAKVIIMGDFNDEPADPSITTYLNAQHFDNKALSNQLYNLSYDLLKTANIGTHYFQGHWAILDQIIVSGYLLKPKTGLYTSVIDVHIFAADFVVQPDTKNLGVKPFPTYTGPKYKGGYSDHLPVYLDLFLKK